jgi:hypothetical protein
MTTQYSPLLKLALPVTGELSGTWGDVVNDNITSMVEQAIAGLATINTWTANSHTLTTANGTTAESRCAALVAADGTGGTALTAAGEIICPALSKLYVFKNGSSYAITFKTSSGTGVAVPAGQTAFLLCDGTNVVTALNYAPTLTLGSALPVSSGGTGVTTATGTGSVVLSNSPTLVTPALGTPASATLTNATGLPVATGISGLGTGVATFLATPSSSNLAAAVTDETGSGALVFGTSPTLGSPTINTPAISGGTINNTVIGGTTRAAGSFTTLDANGNVTLGDANTDTVTFNARAASNLVPSTTNTRDLGATSLVWANVYATAFTEATFPVVSQTDVGTAPNQIPLNQYLGSLAFQNAESVSVDALSASTSVTTPSVTNAGTLALSATGANIATISTNGSERLRVGTGGVVGINTSSPAATFGGLDVSSGGVSLIVGAVGSSTNRTDATNKIFRFGLPHYTNATNPAAVMVGESTATDNILVIGGGTGSFTAATSIRFNTAANNTTNTGTERARIDSSGRLLVGATANITSYLTQIASTVSDALSLSRFVAGTGGAELALTKSRSGTVGTNTVVQNGDTLGVIAFRGADGTSYIQAASIFAAVDGTPGTADMPGRLVFSTTADGASGPTERARIPSTGGIQSVNSISVGNATPTTSGAGITFPATQSASTDANTLDDYEEGTWTPTITYETPGTLSVGYLERSGIYTKIGNLVTISFMVRINAFTKGTASGILRIGGVPFTSNFDTPIGTVGLYDSSFSSQPVLVPGAGFFNLLRLVNNSAWASLDDPDSNAQYFGTVTMRVS